MKDTSKITSSATYTNGDLLSTTTDAVGKTTTYGYNAQTGVLEWVQYPEDTADTRTEYTYDNLFRMATASATTDTGLELNASYTDDLLTNIQTPTTEYTFQYGNFGLRSSVKAGGKALAHYAYTSDGLNQIITDVTQCIQKTVKWATDTTNAQKEKSEVKDPDLTYPGNDATKAPDGYEWVGPDKPGGERGG